MVPDIRAGQHVAIVGPTGSGKTTLARVFLESRPYVVVIDSKGELDWPGWKITSNPDVISQVEASKIIYRPPYATLQEDVSELFLMIYEQGGWTVFVDEVYSLGRRMGEYILLLTRGRSRGISVWTGTQRPRWLPLEAFTESKHWFIFRVFSKSDIKAISDQTTPEVASEIGMLAPYHFLYYDNQTNRLVRSRPVKGG